MKLHEIITEEVIEEMNWRKALATGALAAGAAFGPSQVEQPVPNAPSSQQQAVAKAKEQQALEQLKQRKSIDRTTQIALAKFKRVDPKQAKQIAALAHKYAKPDFPTAEDILSIVGIESSFKPAAVSNLKKDPARGLMQVRPGVWGMDPKEFDSIENQIRIGADILHKYYRKLGDVDSAVHAYNVGITNFKRKTGLNPKYVEKYKAERQRYNPPQVDQIAKADDNRQI